jgi:hypothetical protein
MSIVILVAIAAVMLMLIFLALSWRSSDYAKGLIWLAGAFAMVPVVAVTSILTYAVYLTVKLG